MGDLQPDDPEFIGSYRLRGRIGAGGMGVVYLAESLAGDRVALKVIRPELAGGGTFRRRFAREVEAARRVRSPVTVAVVDADTDASVPWVAFEYVVGPNLDEVVSSRLPRLSAAVGIMSGIAEALTAIHEVGLVHRDLKPSNVLCPPEGVKVIDFGIAAAVDLSSLTGTGGVIGTPAWLAPEQILGEEVSPATDVFAWGCIAVFVLTGHLAFGREGDHPAALLYRIANQDPDVGGVPGSLLPLVASALAKRPAERPTVERLLQELLPSSAPRSQLHVEPQTTGPPPAPTALDPAVERGAAAAIVADRPAATATATEATADTAAERGVASADAVDTAAERGVASTVGDTAVDHHPPHGRGGSRGLRRPAVLLGAAAGVVVIAVAAVLAAHPGGSQGRRSPPPVSTTSRTTVSLAAFGQQYLDIVTPANDAIAAFTATASTLPASATSLQYENLAAGAVAALETSMQALLRVAWPASAAADVRALVASESQMSTDLQNARLGSYADAVKAFEQDVGRTELAGSAVRADLGLPPPKS